MERSSLHSLLAGIAALLLLLALFIPWWTVDIETDGFFGGNDASESAGPFNGNDLIEDEQASFAGLLTVVPLLAFVAGAIVQNMRGEPSRMTSSLLFGVGGLLALIAIVLAATTWPGDDMTFWDSASSDGFGGSLSVNSYAAAGWYLALIGGLLGIVLAMAPVPSDEPSASAGPESTMCQATTKAGNPCSRKATNGGYCTSHKGQRA